MAEVTAHQSPIVLEIHLSPQIQEYVSPSVQQTSPTPEASLRLMDHCACACGSTSGSGSGE